MGKHTDDLLQMAREVSENPSRRELDMLLTAGERVSMALLSIALHKRGFDSVSLTGSQCGILTDETHGNVAGLGLANITTARVFQKIDWVATYTNSITSGIFGMYRTSLPLTMPDDRRALDVSLRGCAMPHAAARMVLSVSPTGRPAS